MVQLHTLLRHIRQCAHPERFGDTAHTNHVRLQDVGGIRAQISIELKARAQRLAERDRNVEVTSQSRMARDILTRQRLLEPGDAQLLELAPNPHGCRVVPLLVGIDRDPCIVAQRFANLAHAIDVDPRVVVADLQLHTEHTLLQIALELGHHFRDRHVQPTAVRSVHGRALARAAEQLVHRHTGGFALKVPKREVHCCLGLHHQAVTADGLQTFIHALPEPLVIKGVLVDQQWRQVVRQHTLGCRPPTEQAPCVAKTAMAIVGNDKDQRHIDMRHRAAFGTAGRSRHHRARQRQAQ